MPDPSQRPPRGPRARVVIVQDPDATDAFRPRPDKIRAMVQRAITNLTGKATVPEAWRSLVSTQDVVGIKVFSLPGPNSGTRPAVVAAVVEGLLAPVCRPKTLSYGTGRRRTCGSPASSTWPSATASA